MTPKQRVFQLGLNRPTTIIQRFQNPRKGTCTWCGQSNQACHLIADVRFDEWRRVAICAECEGFAAPFINGLNKATQESQIVEEENPRGSTRAEILKMCQHKITVPTMAEHLGISRHAVGEHLKALEAMGLVSQVQKPGTKPAIWLVTGKDAETAFKPSLPNERKAFIASLCQQPVTASKISHHLGITRKRALVVLQVMAEQGLVVQVGEEQPKSKGRPSTLWQAVQRQEGAA